MPYGSNIDLPPSVQGHLPQSAQDIYREAFNHAWQTYEGRAKREQIAHRVAWSAVKRKFVKADGQWIQLD